MTLINIKATDGRIYFINPINIEYIKDMGSNGASIHFISDREINTYESFEVLLNRINTLRNLNE